MRYASVKGQQKVTDANVFQPTSLRTLEAKAVLRFPPPVRLLVARGTFVARGTLDQPVASEPADHLLLRRRKPRLTQSNC